MTSEDDAARQEEERVEVEEEEEEDIEQGNTPPAPASATVQPSSSPQPHPHPHPPPSPTHQENPHQPSRLSQPSSSHDDTAVSSPHHTGASATPGASSHSTPVPGPSLPHNHNSSMDDFQTPVLHRPLVTAALAAARSDESVAEFRSPKRCRLMSPVNSSDQVMGKSKEEAANGDDDEEEDDGNSCSICFEPFDNSGRHRLASLKCGHLFGLGCIEKWLKGQGGKCPSCNKKAKMKDIRVIYAKAIKVMDTTERDRALQDLERERELRRRAELEAAQARLQCQQYMEERGRLKEEAGMLRLELSLFRSSNKGAFPQSQASRSLPSHSQLAHLQGQFVHDKTVRICEGGQCRVLCHCLSMAVLVISQPSTNNLFPGFGIKKLSCMDLKTSSYLTLHSKAIRGLSFHQNVDDGLLLSASMDRTIKLTSIITSTVVQTYNVRLPVWSCEWNADNQNFFYVGQQNGTVLEFDTRSTAGPVREMNTEGSKSPVVSLQYLSRDVHAAFKPGGVIVGQLDRVSFFESKADNENRLHILPLEGNLTSLNVDARTRHLLASFRPSAKYPSVRHQLCELKSTTALGNSVISCNVVETFHGGRSQSVLGKTMLMTHPADDSRLLVVAGDEPSESTHMWDTGTSQLVQRLPCQGVPVDFSSFPHNHCSFLATLTDKCLKVHRWN
ncbi:E3 ubiquitin-protein ligase rfwd3.L-like isoform X2 [Babylonia areolata]|uniref:E3 ubiquitin-protein ligase rfwd3.L-like isoform X2 n=1 Tax=Babylonia areolata TaxID=304850 RepID=UPI003FD610E6